MGKRLLILLGMWMCSLAAVAQEHLSFKGIPITGKMITFCEKLAAKGLKKTSANKEMTLFTGNFTGREAAIGVGATSDGQNVYSVVVMLKAEKEWENVAKTYAYFQNIYSRKYGEPDDCIEKIPYSDPDYTTLMYCLDKGEATYRTVWQATGGRIELSIEKGPRYLTAVVVVKYLDSQNIEVKVQKDLDEI